MRPLPSLRQLRYLVAVVEHRHFGRAAESCLVTQSTLSAGIAELEAVLDVQLLERSKRHVVPTPLGLEIAARATRLLLDAEELADLAGATRRPLTSTLRLGVIPTIGPYVLPFFLPQLRARFPSLRVYLREERTIRILELLGNGDIDCALIATPWDVAELEVMELVDDPFYVVFEKHHPFSAAEGPIAVENLQPPRLASDELLLLEEGHCLRDHALAACALNQGGRTRAFQAASIYTLTQMVANGLGITLLPRMALQPESIVPGIDFRLLAGGGHRQIVLAWRRRSARGGEFRLLGSLLKDHLSDRSAEAGRMQLPTIR